MTCIAGIASSSVAGEEKVGLLLAAHGSPDTAWNEPVMQFGASVGDAAKSAGLVGESRTALLEFAQPDLPSAIDDLQAAGCTRIVVLPLFIAPSAHSEDDLPTVLGVRSSPAALKTIREEGGKLAGLKVPLVIGPTLSEGDILPQFALEQAQKLSKQPEKEAVVLLVHGDPLHQPAIDELMRRTASQICGKTGIAYADWANVGVGQRYQAKAIPAIERALESKERVLVIGMFLNISAQDLHRMTISGGSGHGHHGPAAAGKKADPFEGKDVAFSSESAIQFAGLKERTVALVKQLVIPTAISSVDAGAAASGNEVDRKGE